jgi:hypothetical protein
LIKNLKGSFKPSNIPQELAENVNNERELETLTHLTHADVIPRQRQTNLEESLKKRKAVQNLSIAFSLQQTTGLSRQFMVYQTMT